MDGKLVFLGTGSMAHAMIMGLIDTCTLKREQVFCVNPHSRERAELFASEFGIGVLAPDEIGCAEAIVLAFKPQQFLDAVDMYRPYIRPGQTVISIMAAITVADLEAAFPDAAIIRSMPNLALAVRRSATAYCLGSLADDRHKALADELFAPLGVVRFVDEAGIKNVMALCGSGPAYIYYMVESMMEAAVDAGMDECDAAELAKQTLIGATAMMDELHMGPAELRKRVSSAKGTTEAAITTMRDAGLQEAVAKGMEACKAREDVMNKEFLKK